MATPITSSTPISQKLFYKFQHQSREGPEKCSVYFRLPWIGTVTLKFEKQSKFAIIACYGAVQPRILFSTRKILHAMHKDVMPTTSQNIYGRISIRVLLRLPVRGMHNVEIAGQNQLTCTQIYPLSTSIHQNSSKTHLQSKQKSLLFFKKVIQLLGFTYFKTNTVANNYSDQHLSRVTKRFRLLVKLAALVQSQERSKRSVTFH